MQAPIPGSQFDSSNGFSSLGNQIGDITLTTNGTPTAREASKGNALQLGGNKRTLGGVYPNIVDQMVEEAAATPTSTGENPWGTDDLIDINAIDDDWGWLQCPLSDIILTSSR